MKRALSIALALLATLGMSQTPLLKQTLERALDDEYRAFALYTAVNKKFKDPMPFVRIVRAEAQHAAVLSNQFVRYNFEVPKNPYLQTKGEKVGAWYTRLGVPATVDKAKLKAAQWERENVAMYDEMLATDLPENVKNILGRLREVSLTRHLPAFMGSGTGPGMGLGQGMGAGRRNGGGRGPGRGNGPGRGAGGGAGG